MSRWLLLLSVTVAFAAPKRILYVTYTAGFRHDSIAVSQRVMSGMPGFDVLSTEDLSLISAGNLQNFDAVFFFTSGELPLSDTQKSDLLAFVRSGKGFGGAHSATDTLYTWPDYGDMIGAYFDGHPWAQEVSIDIEDPDHPAMLGLAPSFRITDEIYQFREFSRDRVRVLMTLDTRSVDLKADGVQRTDGDFALAWCRNYGQGRVFYTALGHADETWLDARVQRMLLNALRWLTGQADGDATPRSGSAAPAPAINPGGVVDALTYTAPVAPGSLIAIFGANLSSGSTLAVPPPWPLKLAGTTVHVNGNLVPLLYVSPTQINAQLPPDLTPGMVNLEVWSVNHASAGETFTTR